jgi:hypothetical protein
MNRGFFSDPVSSWIDKAVLRPAMGYPGDPALLKDRCILGDFVHIDEYMIAAPPPLIEPIRGYEIGADGVLRIRENEEK